MAEYEVVEDTLLLNSAEFGNASAELGSLRPEVVAARLLRERAKAAMGRGGDRITRNDEVSDPSP